MTHDEVLSKNLHPEDVLYVYLQSGVLKVGTYQGVPSSPVEADGMRMCIGLEPQGQIFEWLRLDYVKSIEMVAAASTTVEGGR
ncbi:MAG: hypothetical protein ACXW5U_13600 [Thermoanaerobaculia bacterium]